MAADPALTIWSGVAELPWPNDAVASSALPIFFSLNTIPALSPNKSIPDLDP